METTDVPLRVGFLLLDRFTLSAFSTFLDPLRLAADSGDNSQQVRIHWDVMTIDGRSVSSSCGIEVHPTIKSGRDNDFHYLVVVGGLISSRHHEDVKIENALRDASAQDVSVIGLCTGVFPMIAAGLLDGDVCCVNWFHHDDLVERFYEVVPDTTNVYHLGEQHGTCAGGVGAASLSLKIIEKHLGKNLADKAARILMVPDALRVFPVQPYDHVFKDVTDSFVQRALLVLERSASGKPNIEDIASELGVSSRHLERKFKKALAITPTLALRKIRMLRAKKLLETTDIRMIHVGMECGYDSPSQFGVAFKKEFGETPLNYRRRYQENSRSAN